MFSVGIGGDGDDIVYGDNPDELTNGFQVYYGDERGLAVLNDPSLQGVGGDDKLYGSDKMYGTIVMVGGPRNDLIVFGSEN